MALIQGNAGTVAEVDGTAHRALRVASRPVEATGHYGLSVVTGTLAAALAANAVVFSARWSAASLCIITSLKTRFLPLTPFTVATLTDHTSFDVVMGTGFTASHTGGTALTMTGHSFKRRTSMATTSFTDLRIATTAALAGAAGLTLFPHPLAQSLRKGNRVNPAAATEETISPTTDGIDVDIYVGDGMHPIVLAQNEGIIVRNRTVWPAAGTGILMVAMDWAEATAY